MFFPQKTFLSNIRLEDLVFFIIETEDPYKAQLLGQTLDYCWDEVCIFPEVKGLLLFSFFFINFLIFFFFIFYLTYVYNYLYIFNYNNS